MLIQYNGGISWLVNEKKSWRSRKKKLWLVICLIIITSGLYIFVYLNTRVIVPSLNIRKPDKSFGNPLMVMSSAEEKQFLKMFICSC